LEELGIVASAQGDKARADVDDASFTQNILTMSGAISAASAVALRYLSALTADKMALNWSSGTTRFDHTSTTSARASGVTMGSATSGAPS
jgi:hypothetical protein